MLGTHLRELRDRSGRPGWEVAAAARMDSTLLSKIETGKRLPTVRQLFALAQYFGVSVEPLERRRLAAELLKRYGEHPEFVAATAIVQEQAGEYRVNKRSAQAEKPPQSVNKRGKSA